MRHILPLLVTACLAACSPSAPKDTAATPDTARVEMSENNRSSYSMSAAISAPSSSLSATASDAGTCLSELGKTASDRLVARCIMVSPATHPPCNAANSCQMIRDEIDRSCAMYGPEEKKPAECAA